MLNDYRISMRIWEARSARNLEILRAPGFFFDVVGRQMSFPYISIASRRVFRYIGQKFLRGTSVGFLWHRHGVFPGWVVYSTRMAQSGPERL